MVPSKSHQPRATSRLDDQQTEETVWELVKTPFKEGLEVDAETFCRNLLQTGGRQLHAKGAKASAVALDAERERLASKSQDGKGIIGSHPKGSHNCVCSLQSLGPHNLEISSRQIRKIKNVRTH